MPDIADVTAFVLIVDKPYWMTRVVRNRYAVDTSKLSYELVSVSGQAEAVEGPSDLSRPTSCSQVSSLDSQAPRSYFCLDASTGDVYTTGNAAGRFRNGSEYVVVVNVWDTEQYPPRNGGEVFLKIKIVSLCLEIAAKYQAMIDHPSCRKDYYLDVPGATQTPSPLMHSYDFLVFSGAKSVFLVAIEVLKPLVVDLIDGEELVFTIVSGNRSGIAISYLMHNKHVALISPMMLSGNDTYTVSLSRNASGLVTNVLFDPTKVRLKFLNTTDYCTGANTCIEMWRSFHDDYRSTLLRSCVNLDEYSFYSKYGLCQGKNSIRFFFAWKLFVSIDTCILMMSSSPDCIFDLFGVRL